MGLAISLVSTVHEKVWYHSNCSSRGKDCFNTSLVDKGGCAIWYDEIQVCENLHKLTCILVEGRIKEKSVHT